MEIKLFDSSILFDRDKILEIIPEGNKISAMLMNVGGIQSKTKIIFMIEKEDHYSIIFDDDEEIFIPVQKKNDKNIFLRINELYKANYPICLLDITINKKSITYGINKIDKYGMFYIVNGINGIYILYKDILEGMDFILFKDYNIIKLTHQNNFYKYNTTSYSIKEVEIEV